MAIRFCCATTHHYMGKRAVVGLFVLVGLAGCQRERSSAGDPSTAATPPPTDGSAAAAFIAEQTLLVGLTLRSDGTALLVDLAAKPIHWTRPGVPFDEARHRPTEVAPQVALPAPGGSQPTTTPGPGTTRAPTAAPPGTGPSARFAFEHWLLVEHGERSEPYVLPLELGAPGEGGGDVLDRWDGSTHVLRTPYFGDGTRLTLVRGEAGLAHGVASLVVMP